MGLNIFQKAGRKAGRKAGDAVGDAVTAGRDFARDLVKPAGQRAKEDMAAATAGAEAAQTAVDQTAANAVPWYMPFEERVAQAEVDKQTAANAVPDEFDILLREAMFASVSDAPSARSQTFTTGSRGLEGPIKSMSALGVKAVDTDLPDPSELLLMTEPTTKASRKRRFGGR